MFLVAIDTLEDLLEAGHWGNAAYLMFNIVKYLCRQRDQLQGGLEKAKSQLKALQDSNQKTKLHTLQASIAGTSLQAKAANVTLLMVSRA